MKVRILVMGSRTDVNVPPWTAWHSMTPNQTSIRFRDDPEVGWELLVSEATVKTHLLHLYLKLGVRDRAAAVLVAFERGLLGTP